MMQENLIFIGRRTPSRPNGRPADLALCCVSVGTSDALYHLAYEQSLDPSDWTYATLCGFPALDDFPLPDPIGAGINKPPWRAGRFYPAIRSDHTVRRRFMCPACLRLAGLDNDEVWAGVEIRLDWGRSGDNKWWAWHPSVRLAAGGEPYKRDRKLSYRVTRGEAGAWQAELVETLSEPMTIADLVAGVETREIRLWIRPADTGAAAIGICEQDAAGRE